MSDLQYDFRRFNLNDWAVLLHERSRVAGWWDRPTDSFGNGIVLSQDVELYASKIALIHSEVSEMLEGLRKGHRDDHLPDRSMEEVEAADVFIRLADYCGARGLNLLNAVVEKIAYNQVRADHQPDARAAEGGKKI